MKEMYRRLLVRLALVIVGAVLLLTIGVRALWLLLPFLLAYVAAWLAEPVAGWLCQRLHLPRQLAAALIVLVGYGALIAILIWYLWLLTSELGQMANSLQDIQDQAGSLLKQLEQWVVAPFDDNFRVRMAALFQALSQTLQESLPTFTAMATAWATDAVRVVPPVALELLVMIVATFLIVADYDHISSSLRDVMQTPLLRPFLRILKMSRAVFGGYLMAAVVMAIGVSLVNLAGFLLMHVQYAALLAALIGVLDFLPYVGSGIILIPWCVYCLATGAWVRALGLLAVYVAVFLFRNVIGRKVLGARYQHNSYFLLVFVFVGWKLGGIGGIVLGQMIGMMVANIYANGMLDGTIRDLRLAWKDMANRLRSRRVKS